MPRFWFFISLANKRNQGSLNKWLTLRLWYKIYRMSLESLTKCQKVKQWPNPTKHTCVHALACLCTCARTHTHTYTRTKDRAMAWTFILITCIQYCIGSFISELRQEVPFDYAKAFDCVDHNKLWKILKFLENSERDGNTTQPDLPLEKSVCRSGSNS